MTLRRDFFAFTAGAVVARTVLPAVAQASEPPDVGRVSDQSPDAELLSWCAALIAMETEWRRRLPTGDAERSAAYDATLASVTATQARTDAGNRAKLAVAVSFYEPDYDINSIVDDILWDAVKALALPPHVAPVAQHADADLLALCTEHRANHIELNRCGDDVGHDVTWPIVQRGHALAEEIANMTATTREGLQGKCRVLLSYMAWNADGGPHWSGHDELMGWSIAHDLLGAAETEAAMQEPS